MHKEKIILIIVLIVAAYLFCHWIIKKMRLKPQQANRTQDEINHMTGREFEEFVAAVLMGCGFTIEEMTKITGDYGADIIVSFNGIRIAIQCKRYQNPVGIKAVQEVISAMRHYDCEEAIVITNSVFTRQAEILAGDHENVSLWDGKKLLEMRDQAIKK